jgi:hypothetical protein
MQQSRLRRVQISTSRDALSMRRQVQDTALVLDVLRPSRIPAVVFSCLQSTLLSMLQNVRCSPNHKPHQGYRG